MEELNVSLRFSVGPRQSGTKIRAFFIDTTFEWRMRLSIFHSCVYFFQLETAVTGHKWYIQKFPNYPKQRKALIPYFFWINNFLYSIFASLHFKHSFQWSVSINSNKSVTLREIKIEPLAKHHFVIEKILNTHFQRTNFLFTRFLLFGDLNFFAKLWKSQKVRIVDFWMIAIRNSIKLKDLLQQDETLAIDINLIL